MKKLQHMCNSQFLVDIQCLVSKLAVILLFSAIFLQISGCMLHDMSTIRTNDSAGFNGSFEFVTDSLPANWYVYTPKSSQTDYHLVFDTADPVERNQSLLFSVKSCSPAGGWHSPGIFNEIDVETGKTYLVTFWVKNTGCKYMIRMDCFKKGTEDANNPKKWITYSDTISHWQKFEDSFVFDNELNRFRFELNILSPGKLWLDDVKVELQ
jgi:hypothetical protein